MLFGGARLRARADDGAPLDGPREEGVSGFMSHHVEMRTAKATLCYYLVLDRAMGRSDR